MINPDYPTDSGSFVQHTYQNQPTFNDTFYWNGGTNNMYNDGSRRNVANPSQAPNPFQQYGQVQNNPQMMNPQQYGNGMPQQQNQGPVGLNGMIESRRTINNAIPTQNNPWARDQQMQPQVPPPSMNPVTQPPVSYQNMQSQQTNPYMNNNGYGYNDHNMGALYNNSYSSFDRKGSWEYSRTQPPRNYPMPNVDWNASTVSNTYGYSNQNPYLNMCGNNQPAFPTAQMNWADIAKENWAYNR